MDKNRRLAYDILFSIEVKKQYSNIALNNFIEREKEKYDIRENFIRGLVYGVLENKIYLDFLISKLIKSRLKDVKRQDLIILRMGIYQIKFLDSVPNYSVVDESVKLAKKLCSGRDKFINAVLRTYIDREIELEHLLEKIYIEDKIKYLSIKYSVHYTIVKTLLNSYDYDELEEILSAFLQDDRIFIRCNKKKTERDLLKDLLESKGFFVRKGNLAKSALEVKGSSLLSDELYKKGYFSVQNQASQYLVELLEIKGNEKVLDMCAAPGGKSLAICENLLEGYVIARDIYPAKLNTIEMEARRLDIENIETQCVDGEKYISNDKEKFDIVLCDVVCSGFGVIGSKPEIKHKIYDENLASLPIKQMKILENGSKYVKKNGKLVYSTCTILKEENQDVVSKFLAENKGFSLLNQQTLLPNRFDTEGFFIAIMIKEV